MGTIRLSIFVHMNTRHFVLCTQKCIWHNSVHSTGFIYVTIFEKNYLTLYGILHVRTNENAPEEWHFGLYLVL